MKRFVLTRSMTRLSIAWLMLALGACSMLRSDLAAPDVAIATVRLGQGDGMSQTLLIDLMITNPNSVTLKFNAINYRVRIEGRDIVNGTSRDPLEIAPNATQKYTVPATINLMSGFGLIRDLTNKPKNKIAYELNATLEPSGLFSMPLTVRKADTFSL